MAEKLDMAMNTFPVVTDAAYIYAEAADRSQVKVEKKNIFSEQFIYRGKNNGIHVDNLLFGFYSMYETSGEFGYPITNGFIFCFVFGNTGLRVQFAINPLNNIFIRVRWSSWSSWKQLH